MDAGQVLQQGTPASIHNVPRNARVADLVGIHNRFEGVWLGPDEATPGLGRLRWLGSGAAEEADNTAMPVLTVRDKGRIPPGQTVSWVIPSDGVTLVGERDRSGAGDLNAQVIEARHLGEISLITLVLADAHAARIRLRR